VDPERHSVAWGDDRANPSVDARGAKELRKIAITIVGGVLVLLGVAALVLPGPGLLLLLSGLVLLSREYAWAGRLVEPVRKRAFIIARRGVASYPHILVNALGAAALIAVGVLWVANPAIPTLGPLGPRLPLGGWETGTTIAGSGVIAMALLVYSTKRFRPAAASARAPAPALDPE
jgi:hypothetical protein